MVVIRRASILQILLILAVAAVTYVSLGERMEPPWPRVTANMVVMRQVSNSHISLILAGSITYILLGERIEPP